MRVQLTRAGQEQGLQGRARTSFGTAMTHPLTKDYLKVRRDGQKTWRVYWAGFWEKVSR